MKTTVRFRVELGDDVTLGDVRQLRELIRGYGHAEVEGDMNRLWINGSFQADDAFAAGLDFSVLRSEIQAVHEQARVTEAEVEVNEE